MINLTQAALSACLDREMGKYGQNRTYVDYLGGYRGECLSLVKTIYRNITGLDMPGAYNGYNWADGYYTYFDQSPPLSSLFIKTSYEPGVNYPKGSLVIYAATHHIAIWLADNGNNTHTVYEQNADPDGSPAHLGTRSNSKITGILLPRTLDAGGKGAGFDTTKQGDNPIMITDTDAEFWRWQKTGMYIRGRMLSRDEFRKSAVGLTWLKALEVLDDSPETDAVQHAQEVGQAALQDNWQGQIAALQNQLKAAQSGTVVTPDDVSWLQKFLAKFGGKS